MIAGSYLAFLGWGTPATSHADTLPLALGKPDSEIEVYVFTDWFCTACRKAEPDMEKAYPDIMRRGELPFIDMPIHAATMNFIPYHPSFFAREKGRELASLKARL